MCFNDPPGNKAVQVFYFPPEAVVFIALTNNVKSMVQTD